MKTPPRDLIETWRMEGIERTGGPPSVYVAEQAAKWGHDQARVEVERLRVRAEAAEARVRELEAGDT